MKTLAKVPLELVLIPDDESIPNVADMEFGKFYYSKEYQCANHLCPCGCGDQTPIPIKPGQWSISVNGDKFSITPSLQKTNPNGCRSHYIITNSIANLV